MTVPTSVGYQEAAKRTASVHEKRRVRG